MVVVPCYSDEAYVAEASLFDLLCYIAFLLVTTFDIIT